MIRSVSRSLAALVVSLGACPIRTLELTEFAPLACHSAASMASFRLRKFVFGIRKCFDGERRADHWTHRLRHIKKSDFATELLGKFQRV